MFIRVPFRPTPKKAKTWKIEAPSGLFPSWKKPATNRPNPVPRNLEAPSRPPSSTVSSTTSHRAASRAASISALSRGEGHPPVTTTAFSHGGSGPPASTTLHARDRSRPPVSTAAFSRSKSRPPASTTSTFSRGMSRPPASTTLTSYQVTSTTDKHDIEPDDEPAFTYGGIPSEDEEVERKNMTLVNKYQVCYCIDFQDVLTVDRKSVV